MKCFLSLIPELKVKEFRQNHFESFLEKFKKVTRVLLSSVLWSNGLLVKALELQSSSPIFKTSRWLQGQLTLLSFQALELSGKK